MTRFGLFLADRITLVIKKSLFSPPLLPSPTRPQFAVKVLAPYFPRVIKPPYLFLFFSSPRHSSRQEVDLSRVQEDSLPFPACPCLPLLLDCSNAVDPSPKMGGSSLPIPLPFLSCEGKRRRFFPLLRCFGVISPPFASSTFLFFHQIGM